MKIPAWMKLLRPQQWIKNGFVIAPLFFAHRFLDVHSWILSAQAALAFISISCVVYIVNDVRDAGEDRLHPVKKNRPLASGALPIWQAGIMAVAIGALGGTILSILPRPCTVTAFVYILFNLGYTLWWK